MHACFLFLRRVLSCLDLHINERRAFSLMESHVHRATCTGPPPHYSTRRPGTTKLLSLFWPARVRDDRRGRLLPLCQQGVVSCPCADAVAMPSGVWALRRRERESESPLPTRTASCPDAFSDLATLEVSFAARGLDPAPRHGHALRREYRAPRCIFISRPRAHEPFRITDCLIFLLQISSLVSFKKVCKISFFLL
jgi:hypothetical protein